MIIDSLMPKRFLVIILASIASLVFGKAALKCIDKETGKEKYLGHSYILGTDNFCVSHCGEDECLTAGSTVCVKRSIVFLSTGSDNKCRNRCNANECYDENFICREYLKDENLKLKKCERLERILTETCESYCPNKKMCYDDANFNFKCMVAEPNKISDGDGSSCKAAKCSDDKKCFDSHYICRSPDPSNISDGDGSSCKTRCTQSERCYDSNFVCVNASSSNISDNDGSNCKVKCSESNKCFDNSYICKLVPENKSIGENGSCNCKLEKCYLTDYTCITLDISHISNGDGGSCLSHCSNDKCSNELFICVNLDDVHLSEGDGGSCLSICNKNECAGSDYICVILDDTHFSLGEGGSCLSKCPPDECAGNDSICIKLDQTHISEGNGGSCLSSCPPDKCFGLDYKCIKLDQTHISEGNGGLCLTECLNPNQIVGSDFICKSTTCVSECPAPKCYDSIYVCIIPELGHVSDNDGGKCKASCSDSNKCYGDDFICVAPDTQKISAGDGGKCIFGCDESKCLNSQNVCQYPDASNLLDYPSIRCVSKCKPERSNCYDPATFVCQVPTEDHLSLGNGLVCIVPNC